MPGKQKITGTESGNCALCKKITKRRCSGCQDVYYCNAKHQKSHWKKHSPNCRPYKLVEDPKLGKRYVAKRDIKVGERVMWEDSPLLITPTYMRVSRASSGPSTIDVAVASPAQCLNCYIELTDAIAKECDKCGWLLCHLCTTHGAECEFTIKHGKKKLKESDKEFGQPKIVYSIIVVARALTLRENDPESYRKLMNLQDIPRTRFGKNIPESIMMAARCALSFWDIRDVEIFEIMKIFEVLAVNSHVMKSGKHEYIGLYDFTSFIENSCRGNCSKTFTKTGGIIFNAALPISKGDHISTSYVSPFMGTSDRQEHLLYTKFIYCRCERCDDRTEFWTMYSAIKCPKLGCDGYSLPPFFTPDPKHTGGSFFCMDCEETLPRSLIPEINGRMIYRYRSSLSVDNVVECKEFVKKLSPLFHPNNHFLVDVELSMLRAYMKMIGHLENKSEEELGYIVDLCRKLTDLFRIITPAETKTRASILILKFRVTRLLNRKKSLNADQTMASIEECQKDLKEIHQLLSPEPIESIEYGTSVTISRLLKELKEYKKTVPKLPPAILKNIWITDNFSIR